MARRRCKLIKPTELNINRSGVQRKPLNKTVQAKWVGVVIALLKEGYSKKYIINYLLENKDGKVSLSNCYYIFNAAMVRVQAEYTPNIKSNVAVHVHRYNHNINKLFATEELDASEIGEEGYTWEQWMASRKKKIKAFNDLIESMMQKENVLRMNSSSFTLIINEETNINITEPTKPKFKISNLSFEEQLEMYELLKFIKVGENELISVIESKSQDAEVISIESEIKELPPANIEQIKLMERVVPEQKPDFVVDPTAKLKETLKKMAAKTLQGAGANLDPKEEVLLKQRQKELLKEKVSNYIKSKSL